MYRAVLSVYRALLSFDRALLSVYRASLSYIECRTKNHMRDDWPVKKWSMQGSFACSLGSFEWLF